MENKNNKFNVLTGFIYLTVLIVFSLSGCAPLKNNRIKTMDGDQVVNDRKSLEKGYEAFHQGNYYQAVNIFKPLQHTENEELSQKARFALVCTQLIIADTPENEKAAIKRLGTWVDSGSTIIDHNDLKILQGLLERMVAVPKEENQAQTELDARCEYECQKELKIRDDQIDQLNQRIKTLKGKIIVLKNKIKSIEEIDQKIQEKKHPNEHRKLF